MKSIRWMIVLGALNLVFLLPAWAKVLQSDTIVAVVNNDVITQSDIDSYLNMVYMQLSKQLHGEELQKAWGEAKKNVVEKLIDDRLIIQEAKKGDFKVREGMVEKRLREIADSFSDKESFSAYLREQGMTLGELKAKIREQIMMYIVIDREVRSKVSVSPQETTRYYQDHKEEFKRPGAFRVNSIFVKDEEARGKVSQLLKEGEDFTSVFQQLSQRQPLGVIGEGELKPEIEEIIRALPVGGVSSPVKVEDGYYFFKLEEIIPPQELSLEESREKINKFLGDEKFSKRLEEWIGSLKKNAYIQIRQQPS
jgi:parvulin-like peptidyl-prolyl isomerase